MKKIINFIVYGFLVCLSFLTNALTIKMRTRLGGFLGRLIAIIAPKRVKITHDNLTHAFPDKSPNWINETTNGCFRNLGIVLLEILLLRTISKTKLNSYIKFNNLELIEKLKQQNTGILMLSGHYGNWEILALGGGIQVSIPIVMVVEPQRNQFMSDDMYRMRTKFGNMTTSRYQAAREIVNAIKKNYVVALLVDQSATSNKDIFVDFFGRPAATFEAPANLALRFKIPVVFGVAVRQPDGTYKVDLRQIRHDDLHYDKQGIEEFTKRHVKALEDAIRDHPDQWAWMHKRWKHQPPKGTDNA